MDGVSRQEYGQINQADAARPPARYEGEDTRQTSPKELLGWYSVAFAAEVFIVCGVGSMIPITLESLARENGYLLNDPSKPCPSSGSSNSTAALQPRLTSSERNQCLIKVFGAEINTASFAMYTFSISVFLQAVLIISMSGAADHGRYRKTLLLTFAAIGSIATMLFLPITPTVYLMGALLAIIANTCSGATFVLLNSFLPLLVRYHPEVLAEKSSQELETSPRLHTSDPPDNEDDEVTSSSANLLGGSNTTKQPTDLPPISTALRVSSRISANGLSTGYVAAIAVQILSVLLILLMKGSLFSFKLVLFFIGGWWFFFSIPAALWLRPRPGPPLALASPSGKASWLAYSAHSWRSLLTTLKRASKLRDVLIFLSAWFLLSDAIATVSGTAVLFAKTTLEMPAPALAAINAVVMVSGIIGALSWARVSAALRLTPSRTILACLAIFELIPLYALLAYIPFIRAWGVIGLQQPWEMYPLALVYGFVLGGLGSYCRAVFGELIPPGSEAAFYALYAITDKGSSIFGPVVVGAITDATGEIRPAFAFLACLIALPMPLLSLVDVQRGRVAGAKLSREIGLLDPTSTSHH